MHLTRLALPLILFALTACTGVDRPVSEPAYEVEGSYNAWLQDRHRQSPAIRQLVEQADQLIERDDFATAEVVLNRALRISNRVASVWSRLAWLAARQEQYKRARDLALRSNGLTSASDIQRFNWQLYRQASMALEDDDAIERASQRLRSL